MKHAEKKTKFLKPCGRVEGSQCLETLEREDLTPKCCPFSSTLKTGTLMLAPAQMHSNNSEVCRKNIKASHTLKEGK